MGCRASSPPGSWLIKAMPLGYKKDCLAAAWSSSSTSAVPERLLGIGVDKVGTLSYVLSLVLKNSGFLFYPFLYTAESKLGDILV